MCRWLAYKGAPTFIDELVTRPEHSLIDQSLHADEGKSPTNGDGFGLGWYGARAEPGLFREVMPAWSDRNLLSLAYQIPSALFFAHVRASTGTESTRSNCHPFAFQNWLFMHNGQIAGYHLIRRQLEALIPDEYYQHRGGTTDSELIFYLLLANKFTSEPLAALQKTFKGIEEVMTKAGISGAFRITAALSNGLDLFAVRYSSDPKPPSLYWRQQAVESGAGITIVSEPFDDTDASWNEIGASTMVTVAQDQSISVTDLAL